MQNKPPVSWDVKVFVSAVQSVAPSKISVLTTCVGALFALRVVLGVA